MYAWLLKFGNSWNEIENKTMEMTVKVHQAIPAQGATSGVPAGYIH